MKLWKDFRTNMMYWRFRYVTRNRLRFQAWRNNRARTRRTPVAVSYRERGMAAGYRPYRSSARRLWLILIVMVVLLTALQAVAQQIVIAPGLVYAVGTLIVVLSVYAALKYGT
ncbi:MAG TPA: hypothetical protein VFB58_18350 [Chloroflexota bacterium]|nr:hypothetical protein [Chloroflexota bacterium]